MYIFPLQFLDKPKTWFSPFSIAVMLGAKRLAFFSIVLVRGRRGVTATAHIWVHIHSEHSHIMQMYSLINVFFVFCFTLYLHETLIYRLCCRLSWHTPYMIQEPSNASQTLLELLRTWQKITFESCQSHLTTQRAHQPFTSQFCKHCWGWVQDAVQSIASVHAMEVRCKWHAIILIRDTAWGTKADGPIPNKSTVKDHWRLCAPHLHGSISSFEGKATKIICPCILCGLSFDVWWR